MNSISRPVETEIIERLRSRCMGARSDVLVGIGDDGAVTRVPDHHELVTVTDALVEGTHFLKGASPRSIGHRSLAVNLSDIAAMGAKPLWANLTLCIPEYDPSWLDEFSQGFSELAQEQGVALIGGDTVRGPLSVSVTLQGVVPKGKAILRSGASSGDLIFVSGHPGEAAGGRLIDAGDLSAELPDAKKLVARFEFPVARVSLGLALQGLVSAMIDVSDGLHTDLSRLLVASGQGANAELGRALLSQELCAAAGIENACELCLTGGEDYELCFTGSAKHADQIVALAAQVGVSITCIGEVVTGSKLQWNRNGAHYVPGSGAFEHF
jgi:thiamine-monophosphate kinase